MPRGAGLSHKAAPQAVIAMSNTSPPPPPSARQALRRWRHAAFALACAPVWMLSSPALASAYALPAPAEAPIERAALNDASPRTAGPDSPAREKTLQTLRSTAQSDGAPSRKQRAPAGRASPDVSPADAAWLLGLLALHGLAMPADPSQAQRWFERAHMLGHPLAPAGLAWCQLSGCVAAPHPVAAMRWIGLLRRTDAGLAQYLQWHAAKAMAPMAEPASASPVLEARSASAPAAPPSGAALQKLVADAARAGNASARNELGLELLAAGEMEKALAQFESASARSEAAAANARLVASRIHAGEVARAPAARRSGADWYDQARRYHQGDGVPANYAEAVRLYQIAASSGDPKARRMLALIFSQPAPDGTVNITWMQQLAGIDTGPAGTARGAAQPVASQGWQRDPSPLYEWVPPEWKTPGAPPRR